MGMPLVSKLFRDNPRLQACLVSHSAHVTPGSKGQHVALIQYAVLTLEGGKIAGSEIALRNYGPTTTAAVLAYKRRRKIINPSYQTSADNIVGRMTIAALDREMALREFARGPTFQYAL
jgi:hypothetical protein